MIEAAEASVENSIGAPLADIAIYGELPVALKHVIRIMTANFYEYREGMTLWKDSNCTFHTKPLISSLYCFDMKAGSMREHLTFYDLTETQTPSGATKKAWIETYKCRAFYKKEFSNL